MKFFAVSGAFASQDEWCRTGSVTEVVRGTTLANSGWDDLTTYRVEVSASATAVQVWVDGTLEIDEVGSFPTGNFGVYTYSQGSTPRTCGAQKVREAWEGQARW